MKRRLTIDADDVLDLVHAAEDYHWGSPLLCTLADWLDRTITDDEIEAFAMQFLTPEMLAKGYGDEDATAARERLTAFKKRYCASRTATATLPALRTEDT